MAMREVRDALVPKTAIGKRRPANVEMLQRREPREVTHALVCQRLGPAEVETGCGWASRPSAESARP